VLRSHKIALDPNNKQATYFKKACGVARFAYNWALAEWERQYKAGHKPKEKDLRRQLQCGENHDHDLNAAKNLAKMAVSSTVTACGGPGA